MIVMNSVAILFVWVAIFFTYLRIGQLEKQIKNQDEAIVRLMKDFIALERVTIGKEKDNN